LRALVLVLLLANMAYFAWAQGLLAAYGLAPARQSEPERLTQQIRPEDLQLVSSPTQPLAATPANSSAASAQCVRVGLFTEQQAQALRPRLQGALPPDSWSFESSSEPVRWIIYMGKYINKDAMNRKRVKLEKLGLTFAPPISPQLNPGLSLGSFGSKPEAESALNKLNQRGIRSARVVLESPEVASLWLKLPAATAPVRTQLDTLKPHFDGKAVLACQ